MKVSVIASLIVGIHVVVVASVAMQGCTTRGPRAGEDPIAAPEPPPPPTMPPSDTVVAPVVLPAEPAVAAPTRLPPPPVKPLPAPAPSDSNVYVVKSGDVLSKIAAAHGCRTADLKELNGIKDANKIIVGQKLLLPDGSKPSTSKPAAKPAAPVKAGEGEYIVKSGDALSKIAAAHGCKTKDLMELNGIKDANKIRIGQKLKLPGAAPAPAAPAEAAPAVPAQDTPGAWVAPLAAPAEAPAPAAAPAAAPAPVPAAPEAPAPAEPEINMEEILDYTVQSGDTVDSVARLFVVSSADILRINKMEAGAELKPGTVIRIPPTSL